MPRPLRLGILTPSSNTALEPLTQQLLSQLPEVSVHFSRFRVLRIALSPDALAQFDTTPIIEAAKLLADARVDVIGWSGTSSGWLGFHADEKLCADITAATGGIPATTSVIALNELVRRLGVESMSLLTPYTDDVQAAIVRNYATIAVDCSLERHLGLSENTSFADVSEEVLEKGMADLAAGGARIVSVFCTNLKAAHLVAAWEKKYDIVVLDTVATVVWHMLLTAGVDSRRITGWGHLFNVPSA